MKMNGFEILRYGNPDADTLLFQMVDDHDLKVIEKEASYIRELSADQDFCLTAVKVNNWNQDLSPWPAPAVFGNEDFGGGAAETLVFLLKELGNIGFRPEREQDRRQLLQRMAVWGTLPFTAQTAARS